MFRIGLLFSARHFSTKRIYSILCNGVDVDGYHLILHLLTLIRIFICGFPQFQLTKK